MMEKTKAIVLRITPYSKTSQIVSWITPDHARRVSQENHSQPELYELIQSSINYLSKGNIKPQFIAWFELKLMDILGMAPQIARCHSCRNEISSTTFRHVSFYPSQGIILCPGCSAKTGESAIP